MYQLVKTIILSITFLILILPAYVIDFLVFVFSFTRNDQYIVTTTLFDLTVDKIENERRTN